MLTTQPPKIDTRKYLSQEELDEYDGLTLGMAFGSKTIASIQRMNELRSIAYTKFAQDFTMNGYRTTRRDKIFGWFANAILSRATPEYQFFLWMTYKVGLNTLGLEEENE